MLSTKLSTKDVYNFIISNYSCKKPFSIVRVGDGEARLFDYPEYKFTNKLNISLSMWFGHCNFSHEDKIYMKDKLIESCVNSDILGIPPEKNKKLNIEYSIIEDFFLGKFNIKTQLANASLHRDLYDGKFYEKLFHFIGIGNIYMIGGRYINFIKHQIHIPTQVSNKTKNNFFKGVHFPHRYNEIINYINSNSYNRFFIVGGGPLGKIYCNEIKNNGGYALDVGSIIDLWAGLKTRGYMK